MYSHPLTATGAVLILLAVGSLLYPGLVDAADREMLYIQAYFCAPIGMFLFLVGVVVQGFRRLERLLVFKDYGAVRATGEVARVFDSDEVKAAFLSKKAR